MRNRAQRRTPVVRRPATRGSPNAEDPVPGLGQTHEQCVRPSHRPARTPLPALRRQSVARAEKWKGSSPLRCSGPGRNWLKLKLTLLNARCKQGFQLRRLFSSFSHRCRLVGAVFLATRVRSRLNNDSNIRGIDGQQSGSGQSPQESLSQDSPFLTPSLARCFQLGFSFVQRSTPLTHPNAKPRWTLWQAP